MDAARNRGKLAAIALTLGSDVPFFLTEGAISAGTGRGELLTPVKTKRRLPFIVLVYPGAPVHTGPVYKALKPPAPGETERNLKKFRALTNALRAGKPLRDWAPLLFNRLEEAALPALGQVEQARGILSRLGVLGARMSGSGSSVFGFVKSHAEGERCLKRLQGYPWKVFLTSCHG